ncbi:metallophosphoesterase family protein [uncultured Polaribacter sp.]|uniref:metallophosphoesterase family protein n=1 Tax=uncultured Polaribacter sp. TaxID=174711 RepID=UPI002624BEAE|nr:metallophosphoesterase family protein [uncultured Polaribacter sp.]
MKIALFSDIHANLPALDSFFADVANLKPDGIYCLGDLVGYNIWPNEVVNAIRNRQIPTISGNHDAVVGMPSDKPSGIYTNEVLGTDQINYLRSLPAHLKLEFQLPNGPLNILLVHGSPRRNNEYLTEETSSELLLEMMEASKADILCFGHTHIPFHRVLTTANGHYKHAINLGSLGKPKDGDPRGCYAVLTIDEKSSSRDKESVKVSFARVVYPVEKAAQAVEGSSLPNEFATALRLAR